MAQCKLTPHEFIQNAFSPMVAVMCSPLVDQTCQKNNLSFIELIQPFCKLHTEAHYREPSGTTVNVRNLRITMLDVNSRPPQPTLARKFLNDSVSLSSNERNSTLKIGNQTVEIPASVPWFEAWRETFLQVQFPSDHEFTKHYVACMLVVSSAENNPAEALQYMGLQLQQLQNVTPGKLPKWFGPSILRYYVLVHDAVDGDNDKALSAFNTMKQTYGDNNCYFLQMNSRPPGQVEDHSHLPDPWSQFLNRQHDSQETTDQGSSPRTPAEVGGVTGMPSRVTSDSCDGEHLEVGNMTRPGIGPIAMSALEVAQEAGESGTPVLVPVPVTVTHHPLSPDIDVNSADKNHIPNNDIIPVPSHINANVWSGHTPATIPHGAFLTSDDLDRLRLLMQEFCVKALLPHVEKQIQQLSDLISNKKGVSRSFLSATKRWFGSNKPGLPGSNTPVNAVIYSSDAPELQLRRLGDMCFMFNHYSLAFQAYHSAKRDFNADQAWLYYAGALEMAALSAFMQGEVTRKAQDYMDEGIITYFNSCKMPQFATRATLLSTECLKGRSLYGEAAKQFIRMTSEDSDLRSALLLEQASYCFLKASPQMLRKYAFHIVLAGHRFSKAGQRKHSLRCYKQAYQVYEAKNWSLAEDHINFTIGRQASNLNQILEAATAFAKILNPTSRQSATQQAAFLREFLTTQQQLISEEGTSQSLSVLPLPLVDGNSIHVVLGALPPLPFQDGASNVVPATGVTFSDEETNETDVRWTKLEEQLVAEAQGSLPMIFKPTLQLYTNVTNNSTRPIGIVGEPITLRVMLQNPLHISLPLHDVRLLWSFRKLGAPSTQLVDNEIVPENNDSPVHTQHLDSIVLKPDFNQEVVLCVTPKLIGELQILGIAYYLSNPVVQTASEAPNTPTSNVISIPGKQLFVIRNAKPKTARGSQEVQDRRLEINVVEPAPCLQVTFRDLSSEMLCGEFQRVTIEFENTGNTALKSLYVASTSPELYSLGEPDKCTSQVTAIALPSGSLAPKKTHSVCMWLRAPDIKGTTNLEMLFYYENMKNNSNPRYRLVKHLWQLTILSSIQLTSTALRSTATILNKTKEVLNLTVYVKNCNQIHDPLMTEIALLQISLASQSWQLAKKIVVPEDVKLEAQEIVNLVVQTSRNEEQGAKNSMFSDVAMNQNQKPAGPITESPYLDFFNRHQATKSKASTEVCEVPAFQTASELETDVKEMRAALRFDATLVVRWKAFVTDSGGRKRSAIGQHHLEIEKIETPVTWPPEPLKPMQQPELMGPLRIFNTDDVSSQNSICLEKYAPLEVLQKLVIYSIQHPPQFTHSFKLSRLCIVPVKVTLQNCSNSPLVVKVNTLGNSSSASAANKSQLYSPHSSSSFRWVGLVGAWIDLGPHKSEVINLSAAVGSPGTYDLGSRLEVLCKSPGAPEVDAISQIWRIESSIVVSSALPQC